MTETKELILERLGELTRLLPEQRMGQLILNFIANQNIFYMNDDILLENLEEVINDIEKKREERHVKTLLENETTREIVLDILRKEGLI